MTELRKRIGRVGVVIHSLSLLGLVSDILKWMKTGELDDYALRKRMYDFRMALSIVCLRIGVFILGLSLLVCAAAILQWMKTGEEENYFTERIGKLEVRENAWYIERVIVGELEQCPIFVVFMFVGGGMCVVAVLLDPN